MLVLLAVGCVPAYEPPTADQPHGIVKLRRSYDKVAGQSLRELVMIDDHSALREQLAATVAETPRTDSLLVHPVPGMFRFSANFFHQEMRTVQESYTVYESRMESQSYDCSSGFGTNRTYRTCTRMVSKQHPVTKQRWVTKPVEVSDGTCSAELSLSPQERGVYLVQYTYRAHSVCELTCYEQIAGPGGQFQNRPCPR
jgi:hypothetical protein